MNHILVISSEFPPGPGGIGRHAYSLALALAGHGQVHVLANQDYAGEDEVEAFTKSLPATIQFTRFALRGKDHTSWQRIRQAFLLVKSKSPDKVFVSGRFPMWVGALLRLRFRNLAVYGFAHGTEVTAAGGWRAKITRWACLRLSGMYPVSTFTARQIPQKTIKALVPNGLDDAFLQKSKHTTEALPWQGSPRLLTVGNLTPRKGQHRVIKALPEILKQFPNAHYHMVGLPTHKETLQGLAEKLGVIHAVTFHGRLPAETDLMRAYASADVFVMLSENQPNGDVEGFGIAILEANALGLPAIGAKGCGIEEAISPDSGILVDGNDAEEIARAIETIMAGYDHYSTGARLWVEKHNWKELVKGLVVNA